jgi:hypothetical protein
MRITENLLADFLTQREAATELKVCERTLDRWRRLDEGPPITKLGRRTLYRRSSLQAWLQARERPRHLGDGVLRKSIPPRSTGPSAGAVGGHRAQPQYEELRSSRAGR